MKLRPVILSMLALACVAGRTGAATANDEQQPGFWSGLREEGRRVVDELRERARPRWDEPSRAQRAGEAPDDDALEPPPEGLVDAWSPPAVSAPSFSRIVIEPMGATEIEGMGTPGSEVVLRSSGAIVGKTVVTDTGRWRTSLEEPLAPGVHNIEASSREHGRGPVVTGSDVRIAIPADRSGEVIVSETRDAVRDRAEALARDAGEAFTQLVPGASRREGEPASAGESDRKDDAGPVIEWLERSARTYQETVIPDLSERNPRTTLAREPAGEPGLTLTEEALRLRERAGDWLARAQRDYQTGVARRLEVPGEDASNPEKLLRPEEPARVQEEIARSARPDRKEPAGKPREAAEQRPPDEQAASGVPVGEAARLADEARRAEEARRREADARQAEDARRVAEETRRAEAEAERRAADARRREEEARKQALIDQEREAVRRREAEARQAAEADAQRKVEEARLKDEQRKAEKEKRLAERAEEKDRARAEVERKAEEKRQKEAARKAEEQARAETRKREAEEKRAADERRKAEAKRIAEEAAEREEERRRRAETAEREAADRKAEREERVREEERQRELEQEIEAAQVAADLERRRGLELDAAPDKAPAAKPDAPKSKAARRKSRDPRPVEGSAEGSDEEASAPTGKAAPRSCGKTRVYRVKGRRMYVVQPGDTLWSIARRYYGSGARYELIFKANRGRIQTPDSIRDCQRIHLPRGRRRGEAGDEADLAAFPAEDAEEPLSN